MKRTGLMGAMPQEMEQIMAMMEQRRTTVHGNRQYYEGRIGENEVVAVFSRWGKVAAATTATTLIEQFGVTEILFTGVAGGLVPELTVGDIVIAGKLVQHDMDARPLMPRFEVPLTGKQFFETDSLMNHQLKQASERMLNSEQEFLMRIKEDGVNKPQIISGDIASGDQFISSSVVKSELLSILPSILCVEMEGAAVAQVCHDFQIPLAVLRVISDAADEVAHEKAFHFVDNYAATYLQLIVKQYFNEK